MASPDGSACEYPAPGALPSQHDHCGRDAATEMLMPSRFRQSDSFQGALDYKPHTWEALDDQCLSSNFLETMIPELHLLGTTSVEWMQLRNLDGARISTEQHLRRTLDCRPHTWGALEGQQLLYSFLDIMVIEICFSSQQYRSHFDP